MDKLIITAALVGAETTREHNPNLPLTPEEIAQAAAEAREAGASIVHIHVRDEEGNPTQDMEIFGRTCDLIREKTDLIVQISTGGAVGTPQDERVLPLDLGPEMATLTCGTVNFGDDIFENPEPLIEKLAARMLELEIYRSVEGRLAGVFLLTVLVWGLEFWALWLLMANTGGGQAEAVAAFTASMTGGLPGNESSLAAFGLYQSLSLVVLTLLTAVVLACFVAMRGSATSAGDGDRQRKKVL